MFKKALILALLILCICRLVSAQSVQDKRRVEEEKRQDLRASEYYLPETKPIKPEAVKEADATRNQYFKGLVSKESVTMADAYRCLTILMGAGNRFGDPASRHAFLVENGILPKELVEAPHYDQPLKKGEAAYMFLKAAGIKGGIILRLFGVHQRYAFKELVYQGIMFPGNVHDVMSGPELIITLTQAADYMAEKHSGLKH